VSRFAAAGRTVGPVGALYNRRRAPDGGAAISAFRFVFPLGRGLCTWQANRLEIRAQ
jgi:hypothetical protein